MQIIKILPCIVLSLVFGSTGIVLSGQVNLDTVDLDTFEIQGDYRPTDLEIDLSKSVIHENLLAIYGATQLPGVFPRFCGHEQRSLCSC